MSDVRFHNSNTNSNTNSNRTCDSMQCAVEQVGPHGGAHPQGFELTNQDWEEWVERHGALLEANYEGAREALLEGGGGASNGGEGGKEEL